MRYDSSHNWHLALEVRRDESGILDPGQTIEDWDAVCAELEMIEDWDDLVGWGPWKRLIRAIDADGKERWYFVQ